MDEWRRKEDPPALLITGDPGIGKSAIVAALVHENRQGQVLAYHCCRGDTPATLEPARFVRSLAGMLAARLEGYAAMLEDAGLKDALERADSDPASAFEAAVLSPLHSLPTTVAWSVLQRLRMVLSERFPTLRPLHRTSSQQAEESQRLLLWNVFFFGQRTSVYGSLRGRKDFLPVEPQGCLSFLILLGEPRFA